MRKRKMYKKFLSCILAAAMVMTGGAVNPMTGKAESVTKETEFQGFAFCNVFDKFLWEMPDGKDMGIGIDILNSSHKCEIILNNGLINKYAQEKGYFVQKKELEENVTSSPSPAPTESTTPPATTDPSVTTTPPATTDPSVTTTPPATTDPSVTTTPPATTDPSVTTTPPATTDPSVTTTPPATTDPSVTTTPPATTDPSVTTTPPATTAPPVVIPSIVPAPATPSATPKIPIITIPTPGPVQTLIPGIPPVQTLKPSTPAPTAAPTEAVTTSAPPSITPAPTATPTAPGTAKPTIGPLMTFAPGILPNQTRAPEEREVVQDGITYIVNESDRTLSVSGASDEKGSRIIIPGTVTVNGEPLEVVTIDINAFKDNMNVTKVDIGKNVTTIGESAFEGCENLVNVKLPSSITEISENSFNGCTSLEDVKIPDKVTKIEEGAFKGCESLTTMKLPSGLTEIGNGAFEDCVRLKDMVIGAKNIMAVKGSAVKKSGCLSLDESRIRYGAKTVTLNIGARAFKNCKKLKKVIINALVKVIGKSAFKDCKSLRNISIYSKVLKTVKGGALSGVHNCKISVPAKKVKPYKKLFKNKGQGKKVVVAKL